MNNFKNLPPNDEPGLAPSQQKEIQQGLWKTLGVFKYIGQIVEVFVPKLVDVFIYATGGETSAGQKGRENRNPPNRPAGPDPKDIQPQQPDQ